MSNPFKFQPGDLIRYRTTNTDTESTIRRVVKLVHAAAYALSNDTKQQYTYYLEQASGPAGAPYVLERAYVEGSYDLVADAPDPAIPTFQQAMEDLRDARNATAQARAEVEKLRTELDNRNNEYCRQHTLLQDARRERDAARTENESMTTRKEKQRQYEVTVKEIYTVSFIVAADSEEQARINADERHQRELRGTEYAETLPMSEWDVEDLGEDL